jgi:uncharacterized protein (TIGR02266 family)
MVKVSVETEDVLGEERRRFERAEVVVRIEYATVDDLFSEFTHDINEGGVFIETEAPQAIGTTVDLQFYLPGSSDPIKAAGLVVRVSEDHDSGPIGMAVEFESLPPDARERINGLIRSMRSHG